MVRPTGYRLVDGEDLGEARLDTQPLEHPPLKLGERRLPDRTALVGFYRVLAHAANVEHRRELG